MYQMTDLRFVVNPVLYSELFQEWRNSGVKVDILGKANTIKTPIHHVHIYVPTRIDHTQIHQKISEIEVHPLKYDTEPNSLIKLVISKTLGKDVHSCHKVPLGDFSWNSPGITRDSPPETRVDNLFSYWYFQMINDQILYATGEDTLELLNTLNQFKDKKLITCDPIYNLCDIQDNVQVYTQIDFVWYASEDVVFDPGPLIQLKRKGWFVYESDNDDTLLEEICAGWSLDYVKYKHYRYICQADNYAKWASPINHDWIVSSLQRIQDGLLPLVGLYVNPGDREIGYIYYTMLEAYINSNPKRYNLKDIEVLGKVVVHLTPGTSDEQPETTFCQVCQVPAGNMAECATILSEYNKRISDENQNLIQKLHVFMSVKPELTIWIRYFLSMHNIKSVYYNNEIIWRAEMTIVSLVDEEKCHAYMTGMIELKQVQELYDAVAMESTKDMNIVELYETYITPDKKLYKFDTLQQLSSPVDPLTRRYLDLQDILLIKRGIINHHGIIGLLPYVIQPSSNPGGVVEVTSIEPYLTSAQTYESIVDEIEVEPSHFVVNIHVVTSESNHLLCSLVTDPPQWTVIAIFNKIRQAWEQGLLISQWSLYHPNTSQPTWIPDFLNVTADLDGYNRFILNWLNCI
jgi:hypothetical protein